MRSWIAFPLLLFFSAQSSAAAKHDKRQGVSGGNAPAALPAFSHESNKFQLHIDKETLEFVNTELGKQPKKRREKSRSSRVVDHRATDTIDRDRVDMFIEQFNRLIQEDQLVDRLGQQIAAIPDAFNPGWNQLENIPHFADVNLQQTWVEVIPVAVVYVPQRRPAPRRPIFDITGITISIIGMIYAFSTSSLLSSPISLNTNGVMENSCPNPQFNTCGQPFCKGAGTQCNGNSFLRNCQCESGDCPASDKIQLFCKEKDCGGKDPVTGKCKGRAGDGKHKNCYCGTSKVFSYPIKQSSFDALKHLVDLGEWKPPTTSPHDPNAKKRKQCYKEDQERMKDHTNWKFVQAKKLTETVQKQCDKYKQSGEPGEHEIQDYALKDDWDYVKLKIYEPEPGMFTRELCHSMFSEINVGCDSSPLQENNPNQFDWKWGGEIELENGIRASIEPVWSRVWTSTDLSDGYCKSKKKFEETNGGNGNNNQRLDDSAKMTMQMCIHQMQHVDKDMNIECGGLLYLRMRRKMGYKSRTDCAKNTWKCLSYNVDVGKTADAGHYPAFAQCEARTGYRPINDWIPPENDGLKV